VFVAFQLKSNSPRFVGVIGAGISKAQFNTRISESKYDGFLRLPESNGQNQLAAKGSHAVSCASLPVGQKRVVQPSLMIAAYHVEIVIRFTAD